MRTFQMLAIVLTGTLAMVAAPGFAQTATPTGTPVAPTPTSTAPAPTPTSTPPAPTPTPTLPAAGVSFDEPTLNAGQPVTASGSAVDGPYCLVMVTPGVFTVGTSYTGTPVASADITVSGGAFSGATVTSSAPVGQYDLLMLLGPCSTATIISAGDRLDAGAGLDVSAAIGIPGVSKAGVFAILALIAVGGVLVLWRRL